MLRLDYELVRRYHPDSAFARSLPPETAHTQFQAMSRAYDVLRGKTQTMAIDDTTDGPAARSDNDVGFEIWKARQARKADIDVTFDERWKDKMLVGLLLFVSCQSPPSVTGPRLFRLSSLSLRKSSGREGERLKLHSRTRFLTDVMSSL